MQKNDLISKKTENEELIEGILAAGININSIQQNQLNSQKNNLER